jgi:hypothetical protein
MFKLYDCNKQTSSLQYAIRLALQVPHYTFYASRLEACPMDTIQQRSQGSRKHKKVEGGGGGGFEGHFSKEKRAP